MTSGVGVLGYNNSIAHTVISVTFKIFVSGPFFDYDLYCTSRLATTSELDPRCVLVGPSSPYESNTTKCAELGRGRMIGFKKRRPYVYWQELTWQCPVKCAKIFKILVKLGLIMTFVYSDTAPQTSKPIVFL
jgi:hypothetical protein